MQQLSSSLQSGQEPGITSFGVFGGQNFGTVEKLEGLEQVISLEVNRIVPEIDLKEALLQKPEHIKGGEEDNKIEFEKLFKKELKRIYTEKIPDMPQREILAFIDVYKSELTPKTLDTLVQTRYTEIQLLLVRNFWGELNDEQKIHLLELGDLFVQKEILKTFWFMGNKAAHFVAANSVFPEIKKILIKYYLSLLTEESIACLHKNLFLSKEDYEKILNPKYNFGIKSEGSMEKSEGYILEFFLEKAPKWVLCVLAKSKFETIQGQLIFAIFKQKRLGDNPVETHLKVILLLLKSEFKSVRNITKGFYNSYLKEKGQDFNLDPLNEDFFN